MSDSDGIQISDKPSWEHTAKELFGILGKWLIAMPSKLLEFKPFCLYLATWLLVGGLYQGLDMIHGSGDGVIWNCGP
ncbi:MAG: hypothetical protein LBP88_03830 [Treponema sp.]|jgi:hypothetical protein|nr:hypothetical protein [Treponema sp.]